MNLVTLKKIYNETPVMNENFTLCEVAKNWIKARLNSNPRITNQRHIERKSLDNN